jgi:hypothetical protein
MFDFSREVVNKNVKQKRTMGREPCGAPDSSEKGEENVPKVRTNEDIFSK